LISPERRPASCDSIVKQAVGPCKTEASQKPVPLDTRLVRTLRAWRRRARFRQPTDWVFASPATQGSLPFWGQTLMRHFIRPTAIKLGITKRIGWHTFRHYAEFRTMPNWLVPLWRESGESAGTPFCYSARFGIVRYTSQVLKEAQQLIIRAVRSSLSFDGCSLGEHLFFQSKIGIEVDLGCLD
jgi:hypothetical protein